MLAEFQASCITFLLLIQAEYCSPTICIVWVKPCTAGTGQPSPDMLRRSTLVAGRIARQLSAGAVCSIEGAAAEASGRGAALPALEQCDRWQQGSSWGTSAGLPSHFSSRNFSSSPSRQGEQAFFRVCLSRPGNWGQGPRRALGGGEKCYSYEKTYITAKGSSRIDCP